MQCQSLMPSNDRIIIYTLVPWCQSSACTTRLPSAHLRAELLHTSDCIELLHTHLAFLSRTGTVLYGHRTHMRTAQSGFRSCDGPLCSLINVMS